MDEMPCHITDGKASADCDEEDEDCLCYEGAEHECVDILCPRKT